MAFEVPPLPYDYNALEPHIDEATMRVLLTTQPGLGHFHPSSANGGEDVAEAVMTFASGAVASTSASRIGQRKIRAISVTELVSVAFLFTVLAFPVRAIGWVLAELPRSVAGWDRLQAVLTASGEMPYGDTTLDRADDRPATAAQAARWAEQDLWVMNADGSGLRNLTRTPRASDGGGATWAR